MFENERDFRKLVAGLTTNDEPNPAHRERLRRQMLQTFEQGRNGAAGTEGRKQSVEPIRPPFLRLAIAAAILVAAMAGVWRWFGPAGARAGFDRVRLATESAPWLCAVATRYSNGDARTERHWCNFAAKEVYVVGEDEAVVGYDYGTDQMKLTYNPRLKTLVLSELPKTGPYGVESAYNFVQAFAAFAAKDDVTLEESTAQQDGRTVRLYAMEKTDPALTIEGKAVAGLRMTVFADPRTKRIVAAGVEYQGPAGAVLAREDWVMSYPQSGPASVYDVGVPRTARVSDMRQGYRGTPGEAPTSFTPTPASTTGFRLEPLKIELPRPKFTGTPVDTRTPNLERPRGGLRPAFLAPAGTVNLARGKPVASSDSEPLTGSLDLITDGDKEAVEGSVVELGPKPQYVTIDLREQCEIYAVVIWHQHRWPRVYYDVIVQVSDDPAFQTGVRTIFNSDADDSLGLGAGHDLNYTETYEGKLIDGKSIRGRYIRCYSNGNTHDELNHYIEIEVYGRPVKAIQGK
ncbi:MAG: hypothetical protein ABFE13_19825 [Phycisphaerales bacterium]